MRTYLVAILLCILSFAGYGQTITYDTIIASRNCTVTRDVNHFQLDSVPGVFGIMGAGQVGSDPERNYDMGPHWWTRNRGWDGTVTLGSGVLKPVIITFQIASQSVTAPQLRTMFDAAMAVFKIKRRSLHGTGVSAGGHMMVKFVTYKANANDNSYANYFRSLWIVQGVEATSGAGAQDIPFPQRYGSVAKNFGLRIVYVKQLLDVERQSSKYIKAFNDSMPGSGLKITSSFGSCGHCNFNEMYDPERIWTTATPDVDILDWSNTAGTQTTPLTSTACTYLQWLLRNGDTTLTGGNPLPVVNAGGNQTITLPDNDVNLNGSATDADGIASYLWEKISGPDSYSFGDDEDPTTTFSGLVAGTYQVRLTATDNNGGVSSALATITVNPEAGNDPPVVSAGGDKAITLPTDEIELIGTAEDDGSISSYTWTKTSGGAATIESPSSATTMITGLSQGSYVFRLTVEDDQGSVSFDEVTVNVTGATGANKTINVSIDAVNGYIKDPAWNSWGVTGNFTSGVTSQPFKYSDGSQSTITAYMNRQNGTVNNGATYKGFPGLPDSALQYVSNSNYPRTLTFSGFDNSKFFNLLFIGSRHAVGYRSKYTANGVSIRFGTSENKNPDSVALFTNIAPSNGQIIVLIDSAYGSSGRYNHLNAFVITEISSDGGNQLPVADAGNNDTLTLPTSSTTLDGTGSVDPDGSITAYLWTQISGPNTATIATPTANQTDITDLIRGTYWFRLRVTDNLSGISYSEVMVRVNSSTNETPEVLAGNDTTITAKSSTLNGTAFDWDGTVASVRWTKISGPLAGLIVREDDYNTELFGLAEGEYQFEFAATDNTGATGKDTLTINVIEPPVILCKAEAGDDQLLPVGTYSTELIGEGSFGQGELSHTWTVVTNVTQDYIAKIKHADSQNSNVMLLPFVDGGYQFEHMVVDTGGCVSKDTVKISIDWGAFPPQSANSNGWRRITAADTTAVNAVYGPGYWKVNDVYIDGANQGTVTGGKLDINLTGVTGLFITPGQNIWIRAGHYRNFRFVPIAGQVAGSAAQPIQISNYGGQVRCQSFTVSNIKNVKVTGKYLYGVSGHPNFKGHDSSYAWSRGSYGICLDNEHASKGAAMLRVAGTTTDSCEFEYIEAGNGGFTAMMFKNDNTPEVWSNFKIHDCYIYNTDGEGVYLGSTSGTDPQNQMRSWKVYNNRILYTGNEVFQFNQIYAGTDIYNNMFVASAMRFLSPFSRFQSFSMQNQMRAGNVRIRNNMSLGFRESMYNSSYGSKTGVTVGIDTVYVQNNLHLYGTGYLGGFFSDGSGAFSGMVVKITDNLYGKFNFRGNEYYTGTEATNQSTVIKTDAAIPKFYTRNNVIDGSGGKTVFMTGIGLDSSGNTTASIPLPQFVNSGWPVDFNFNYYEMWMDSVYQTFGDEFANQVGVNTGAPITYDSGRYVLHGGLTYLSLQNNNHGHMPKGRTDAWWQLITWQGPAGKTYTYPPDDWRLVTGSYYQQRGMGLMQSAIQKPRFRIKKHGRMNFTTPD